MTPARQVLHGECELRDARLHLVSKSASCEQACVLQASLHLASKVGTCEHLERAFDWPLEAAAAAQALQHQGSSCGAPHPVPRSCHLLDKHLHVHWSLCMPHTRQCQQVVLHPNWRMRMSHNSRSASNTLMLFCYVNEYPFRASFTPFPARVWQAKPMGCDGVVRCVCSPSS